jgi:hypothetical protein
MDNGGISQTEIVHYCVQGGAGSKCCQSREEALEKTQAAYESVFSGGFEAPLLYRFKHTVPANHFMQDLMAIFPPLSTCVLLIHTCCLLLSVCFVVCHFNILNLLCAYEDFRVYF